MRVSHLCLLLALPSSAFATDYIGRDFNGASLNLADGDTVEGTFTNVGTFTIPEGATVTVVQGTALEIHAAKANILGTLDGTASGEDGGKGGPDYNANGLIGDGDGGGGSGVSGYTLVGGGGGAGYGGEGGQGGHYYSTYNNGPGGDEYGTQGEASDRPMGSGGGGGGGDYYSPRYGLPDSLFGGQGGNGGASIYISAPSGITVDGEILADGGKGEDAGDDPTYINEDGGGGGGSGGTIVLETFVLDGDGTLTANGGNGGSRSDGSRYSYYGAGGGGGAGGRIKILHGPGYDNGLILEVEGGTGGTSGRTYSGSQIVEGGDSGTTYYLEIDPDPDQDNIDVPYDNCPVTYNPVQYDDDGDGIGDVCDVCPTPADPHDTDGDTICDNVDVCAGFDDLDDDDVDGVPLGCDNCPIRPNTSQIDQDLDGTGDACDPCPLPEDPIDSDGDDVCDNVDACPGFDDRTDTDLDGLPNDCDICPTAADAPLVAGDPQVDTDGDGLGDACDRCPTAEDPIDSDNDGVCDSVDACPGFFDGFDDDGDAIPNDCDVCPFDAFNDSDRDGLCGDVDICPFGGDGGPDADNDGIPEFCDNCQGTYNPSQGDTDLDGHGDVCDCAPGVATAYPGAVEFYNAFDDNCDGEIDNDVIDAETWYQDVDGDGYGNENFPLEACFQPFDYVANSDDCNDTETAAHPGADEICDGIDNDCNGVADPPELQCDVDSRPDDDPVVVPDEPTTGTSCSHTGGLSPLAGLMLLMPWFIRRRLD